MTTPGRLIAAATLVAFSVLLIPRPGSAQPLRCGLVNQPSATLLLPYFEVDVEEPGGRTTLFSVANTGGRPALAHAVMWTNWGIPVLSWDFFVPAEGLRSFDLRKLIQGRLPETSPPTDPPEGSFESCTDPLTLPEVDEEALVAMLAGEPHPDDGFCYSKAVEDGRMATGYITIDVVRDCSGTELRTPLDASAYFLEGGVGLATNENVLWGDWFLVDPSNDFAQGERLVTLVADSERFGTNDACVQGAPCPDNRITTTFYGSGGDNRMPLPKTLRSRFLNGGQAGKTDLVVWKQQVGDPANPIACGTEPASPIVVEVHAETRNESGGGSTLHTSGAFESAFRATVGGDRLPVEGDFGIIDISARWFDSRVAAPLPAKDRLQAWMMPLVRAEGRFSIGMSAVAIDDFCREAGDDEPFRLMQVLSETELAAYLKRGLFATYSGESPFLYGPGGAGGVISPPIPGADLPVSQTNVQEAGVDEQDRIKSDGRHLFILNDRQSLREPPAEPAGRNRIRILEIDAGQPSARAVSELELAMDEDQLAHGIYLRAAADQLIVTASSLDLGWLFWYSPLAWLDAKSTVASVDVGDPVHPEQGATLELDGAIISSRRIGDYFYLATRFQPHLPGLEPFDPNGPESVAAIERIEAAQLDDLVPSYRSTANPEWRPLVRPSDCYLPTEEAPVVGADLISLVAIDLATMEVASSKCFVGATETLYVSPVSIYLASTRYEYSLVVGDGGVPWTDYTQRQVETDLHKFSLASGRISYEASGSVDGHLGWNILRKPFRLSERGDDLRVITYTDELTADRSPVAITVLRDTGNAELEVLSRLPNEQRPDPIGKPGEELYATRFVGDRAYLVTFLVTDPLVVIDLSRPEDPFVAGELEITGFSDYLHPIDGDYVLGIGKDAIPDPGGDFRGAWYQGLKISLYDVSDPNHPFEADAAILGKRGSWTPVLQDHRAATFLQPEGSNPRVAIGAVVHERYSAPPGTTVYPWTFFEWSYSGLHLFEVDTVAGRILRQGEMRVEEYGPLPGRTSPLIQGDDDRSVLAGDAVFYVHGDDVYTGLWSHPGLFEGPK